MSVQSAANDYTRRDYDRLKQERRPVTENDQALLRHWFRGQIWATAIFAVAIGTFATYAGFLVFDSFRRPQGGALMRLISIALLLLLAGISALLIWRLFTVFILRNEKSKTVYFGSVTGYTDVLVPERGSRNRLQTYFVFLDGVPFEVPKEWLLDLKTGDAIEIECFEISRVADIIRRTGEAGLYSIRKNAEGKPTDPRKTVTLFKAIMDFFLGL